MTEQGVKTGRSSREIIDLATKSAATMTAASMFGLNMMTQAIGVWMSAVARLMEQAQEPSVANVTETSGRNASGSRPANAAEKASKVVDDLKKINGIGPKLEKVLNGLGVTSYAEVAALETDTIASLEGKLGLEGRIGRDGWIEQASTLAAKI